jgi:hypothetical protein
MDKDKNEEVKNSTKEVKNSNESSETQKALDTISRWDAIDALDALCDRECEYSKKQRSVMCGACHLGSAFDVIEQLPPAQPEPLVNESRTLVNDLVNDTISRQAAIDVLSLGKELLSRIAGIIEMAEAMKEVLKA